MTSQSQAGRRNIDPVPGHWQELKWPRGAGFPGSAAGQGPYRGRERRWGAALGAGLLAGAVAATLDAGRFPVLLGGDCSIVLGPLLALRRRGRYGLAFLDGHADFQHPSDEPNGEVASLDLAVATGRGPDLLTDLDGLRPLVRDEDVALVGYRVLDDNDHFLAEHIRSTAITVVDLAEVRETGTGLVLEKALATVTKPDLEGFWVHLDVDVLDDALMPAVDYRHPGGLTWQEATEILGGLLASDRACGLEVTIFNPRLDPGGGIAQRLSDLITSTVPRPAGDGGPDRLRHP